jgi:transcriptional regulator with XRE-family HTH domain
MKNVQNTDELIDSLLAIAKKRKISFRQIAEKTGIKESNVSRFFSKEHTPNMGTLVLIANSLDIKITLNSK